MTAQRSFLDLDAFEGSELRRILKRVAGIRRARV